VPLTTAAELGTFLGIASVDADRATLLISLVEDMAADAIDGAALPASAKGVVLSAAARAYTNPGANSSESVGGVSASYAAGGMYLSRTERLTLRRAAGIGGGAFTINGAPAAGTGYVDALAAAVDDAEEFALDYPDMLP
jgi:hypothetical protein